ncbi:MAG: hypothetical protein V4556_09865 [Bacteroidota bacterium]
MIKHLLFTLLTATLLFSCGSNKEADIPNTDIDVARAFIRKVLDNDLNDANKLILQTDINKLKFESFKKQYEAHNKAELEEYKNADIVINEIGNVTDTITVINYSNTYKKDFNQKVKVVKVDGQWQVDFQYTSSGNL